MSFRSSKAQNREPLAPAASVRRRALAVSPAVIPAKAGIQYPPGWAGLRKQFPSLGEGRSRRRHGSGRTTWGYWIPVFGCAETGTTGGAWARVGASPATALGTNGPRISRCSSGVTAERMRAGGPLSQDVIPVKQSAEPGTNGTRSKREAEGVGGLPGCHTCEGRYPVSAGMGRFAQAVPQPRRGALAATSRLGPHDLGLLDPGLRLRRNRDDRRSVGARRRVSSNRSGNEWAPARAALGRGDSRGDGRPCHSLRS